MEMSLFNTSATEDMIPAYKEGWKSQLYSTREDYIKATLIADIPKEVRTKICDYLSYASCNPEVREFLAKISRNFVLLLKTQIVSDLSHRNCTVIIRPDGFINITSSKFRPRKEQTVDQIISFFVERAETLFIILSNETWTELNDRHDSGR